MGTIVTHYESLNQVRTFLDGHRQTMIERRDGEHGTRRYRDEARGQVIGFDIAIKALDDYLRDHPEHEDAVAALESLRDTLPDGHHEKPGIIRSIEVLRYP